MKKILVLLGSLFFVLLVAIITLPFFIDVDHYRPQIIEQADKHLNGKLELGKLKLSLWGSIKVYAESIKLSVNGYTKPLLNTDRFYLEIPYTSIFAFHPQIVAVLDEPKLQVDKNAAGEMNVFKVIKTAAIENATASRAVASNNNTANNSAPSIPAFLAGATLGLKINKGDITYVDQQAKANYQFEGFNLDIRDLGPTNTMKLYFSAPMKGASPLVQFNGTVEGSGKITPILTNGAIHNASGEFAIDATKLAFDMQKGMFKKVEGVPLTLKAVFAGTEKDLLIKNLEFNIHDYKVYSKGLFVLSPQVHAKFEINSDNINLEKLQDLIPMLSFYKLKGNLGLMSTVESDGTNHKVSGEAKLSSGEVFMADMLKAPVKITSQVGFTENSLNIVKTTMDGPGADLALQGTVSNFSSPQFNLSLTGKVLDVDRIFVFAPSEAKKLALPSLMEEAHAAAAPTKKADINPFYAYAQNPIMAKAAGNFHVQLGKATVSGATMENLIVKAQLNAMQLKLLTGSFRSFGGDINSTGEFNLKSPALAFKSAGNANKISAKEALTSYFPKYKNTLEGNIEADWNISGLLYPEIVRMKALKGSAKIKAVDGALRSIDFQETISSSMQKIPFLKNVKTPKIDSGFKTMTATIAFKDGVINVDPMQITGRGNGLDIKGKAKIQENLEHESFFDIYDSHSVLPKEISKGANAASVALRFTGPISAPKPDYEYSLKKLASSSGKDAAKNLLKKALGGDEKGGDDPLKSLGDKLKKKIKFF